MLLIKPLKYFFPATIFLALFVVFSSPILSWAQETPSIETVRQRYRKAYCAYQKEDFQTAAKTFKPLLKEYPQMGDYALHYLAKSQFALGKYIKAQITWKLLVDLYPKTRLRQSAILGRAEALFREERYLDAAKIYRQLIMETLEDKENLGLVYLNYGLTMEATGQPAKAAALYQHLWFHHPAASTIPEVEQRMKLLAEKYGWVLPIHTDERLWKRIKALRREKKYTDLLQTVDEFLKKYPKSDLTPKVLLYQGLAYLSLSEREKAILSFRKIARNYSKSRQVTSALFYAGKNYWNLGNEERAILNLNVLLKNHPHSSWNDEALYVLGRIHEGNQSYSRALKTYSRLARSYPKSVWADKGTWRMGWIHYRLKKYPLAIKTFDQAIKKPAQSPWREAALYWKGRSQENMGQIKKAINTYMKLINIASYTYYAQLARKQLPRLKKDIPPPKFPKQIEQPPWKMSTVPAKNAKLRFHQERVQELLHLSSPEDLKAELGILEKSNSTELEFWVFISRAYQVAGDYNQSIRILWRYLALKKWGAQQLPPEVWPLFFPRFYWDNLKTLAQEYELDPYILTAIIRRESVFDHQAESWAGAIGLMQIMPTTGAKIAKNLGDTNFTVEQLYSPLTNLRYGAFYFSQLLKRFHSNLYLALSAYNAGEHHTKRWQQKHTSGGGWEEFVENISFTETRHYVRQVISNYNNYRLLYLGDQNVDGSHN